MFGRSLIAVSAALIFILASAISSIQAAQEKGTLPDVASNDWSTQAQQAIAAANWTVDGDLANGGLGWSLGAAGDVNGDGYADVLVAAPWYDNGYYFGGRVYLYYGSATGLTTSPAWIANGNTTNCCLGRCVATAGDINKDGYSDILISDGYYYWGDDASGTRGHVYVWYGSASGLKPNATPANADLTLQGSQSAEVFGFSCASAGDVNKDGYSDIIVSAPFYNSSLTRAGRAYVFYGSATGLTTSPAWTVQGDQAGSRFGWSAASAGDVNGDGYADVIIGAPSYNNAYSQGGRAFVYYGSGTGLPSSPSRIYDGAQSYDLFGWSVASAGDVNKDGYGDVLIGAAQYDNGQTDEGRVYAYYGSSSGLPATPNWSVESDQLSGKMGCCVAAAGDFNGDGIADVLIGAHQYDSYDGRAYIYYGSASGLATSATVLPSPDHGAQFGWSVAGIGDVNRDGAADVIIGASGYSTGGQTSVGRAYAYYGTPPANPSEALEIVSVNQTPDKKVDIIYNLTPADPAPANGYDISTLVMATTLDCAATSGTPDNSFDDITAYVTGSTHIVSGSGLLTWNVQGMPAGALKTKYWKAGVSVLFRLKAVPKP
ncbi:MAG: FG-GAP-like repeat-containing protein [Candidatus Sumerlaeota bacterium]|nr:FG-GAP-like repeat-containing protein [Candidatus Sumerlaeota bacterium]